MSSAMNSDFKIHPKTSLAHVEMQVVDLANMLLFYVGLFGLQVVDKGATRVSLSPTGKSPALLTLVERKDAVPAPSTSFNVGLYHTAFRFPDRRALGTTLLRIVAHKWPLQGASDHRVSEAIYLADPEGNGIEIYRDRPREQWPRMQDSIEMGNLPLDLNKLIEEADQEAAKQGKVDPAMDIGHIHLQVSDLATAHAFYHDLLGLDVVMSMPTALFLSAGGYHHHVGANVWHSRNAPRRDPNATGLLSYAYLIPDEADWLAVFERVKNKVIAPIERDSQLGVSLDDQDGLRVELLTPATEAMRNALANLKAAATA